MLYFDDKKKQKIDQGKFKIILHYPGFTKARHDDHGYGPLAVLAESFMAPDTWIKLHPHNNDEIISWVPEGVMRHDDVTNGALITDPEHLMVMNAGTEFWHEERTLATDPPLRMLQIFVRPHTANLKPVIQHGELQQWSYGIWRKVFGPEHSGSAFYVRNDVEMYDLRIKAGEQIEFPGRPGYATYFMTYTGGVSVSSHTFNQGDTGLLVDETMTQLIAIENSLVLAFVINPQAQISKAGTLAR